MKNGKKREKSNRSSLIFLLLLAFLIVSRLIYLYMEDGVINTLYRNKEYNTTYFRGNIYDRRSSILAMDRNIYVINIDASRCSEPSRLTHTLSPYVNLNPIELENLIRSGGSLSLESNLLMEEIDRFENMIDKERFDECVSISEKRERVYPQKEHGRLIIGREGIESEISAESIYDDELTAPLSITAAVSEGRDITLALSERMQYTLDHINSRYSRNNDLYLMLAILDYSTTELYALAVSSGNEDDIDYEAIRFALSGRDYTILKQDKTISLLKPEDISQEFNGNYLEVKYAGDFALLALSSLDEAAKGAIEEIQGLLAI